MTTLFGPDFIALQVRDLPASTRFYVDVLGFEVAPRNPPGAIVFATKPIPLALREPLQAIPKEGSLGTGMVLWVACSDADTLHDALVERGCKISRPLADGPFGRFFSLNDPDGYAITFHTAA